MKNIKIHTVHKVVEYTVLSTVFKKQVINIKKERAEVNK